MELLDRYLREVALWLPRRQSTDIVAEISADLQAEAEGQAQALGRPLSRGEEEAILTRWGHPMLVASRYQPQESLIGPALLPTYHFVLKVLSLVYVLPWLSVWLWFAIGVLVVCLMLPIALVQVVPGGADGDRLAMLARWINLSWQISLVVAGVVLAARAVLGIVRVGRVDRGTPAVAAG